jgi:thioredoxin reductase
MNAEAATSPDVLVIGSGPSGLGAATELSRRGHDVLVVERDAQAGGIPRFCHHQGFGIQDLRRTMSGPRYAEVLVQRALASGATIEARTTARRGSHAGTIELVSPKGCAEITPAFVVLATGVRERPRPARLVPGSRPSGIFTTGELQRWVHEEHLSVGQRALVVGAEHISFSAVMSLRDAGVRTIAMVTESDRHHSVPGAEILARTLWRTPLVTSHRIAEIAGHQRVSSVRLEHVTRGTSRWLEVDTVVFTGDWIAESTLGRELGVETELPTQLVITDDRGRTSLENVVAVGNVTQPAQTASKAALDGRRVGQLLAASIEAGLPSSVAFQKVVADPSLLWIAPQRITPGRPLDEFALRTSGTSTSKVLEVRQGSRRLLRRRLRHATPERGLSIPGAWVADVDPHGGEVRVGLVGER